MAALAGQTIGILGLGRSGLAAARLALHHGAAVYASDAGATAALQEAAAAIRGAGGTADVGGHDLDRLAACDSIVLSPGIPPDIPLLREPALASIPIVPEIEFAFLHLDAPVIAITGTNGKSTVTALITHLLREAGYDAAEGGNIGTALSEVALREPAPDVAVVEASSFQLGLVERFAPRIGVLTNLAPDHLDRYDSVEAYYADKARLFLNADASSRWVINGEDDEARRLPGDAAGERFWFHASSRLPDAERGGELADGRLRLRLDREIDLIASDELRLLGPHNRANAIAAALAAVLFGAEPKRVGEGLRSFPPLAHRLEPVAEIGGVLWINDSKATNLASTRVALDSMERPVVLMLGGRHKGEPYSGLLDAARGRVRNVVAYGDAAQRVEADLAGELTVERVGGGFDAAVERAAALARPGDAVLLSPACSSFDMFANFEERGRRFVELVRAMEPRA